jgi:hypothetical protein
MINLVTSSTLHSQIIIFYFEGSIFKIEDFQKWFWKILLFFLHTKFLFFELGFLGEKFNIFFENNVN